MLWAVLEDGIAKIEYPSPFSRYAISAESKENVQQIVKFHENLFVGTDKGLYILKDGNFHLIKSAKQKVWDLLPFNNTLLVTLERGLYIFNEGNETLTQINNLPINSLTRSKIDSNRIFIGHTLGLSSIYYKNGKWNDEGNIPGVIGSVFDVVEVPNGNLWLESIVNWIWKVSFKNKDDAIHMHSPVVKKYSLDKGLPDDLGQLYLFENNLVFAQDFKGNNIFKYDVTADTFVIYKTFYKLVKNAIKRYETFVN